MLSEDRFRPLSRLVERLKRPEYRRDTGLVWAEGPRAFLRIVDHGRQIHTVVVCERLLQTPAAQMLVRRLRRTGTPIEKVSPEQYRALSQTARASGIGTLVRQHWTPLESLSPAPDSQGPLCWVAISRIRSSGNLGTIVRTAEAAGAAGLIVMDERTDPFDAAVLRGSMGSVLSMTWTRASLPQLAAWAKRQGLSLVGTSPRGEELFTAPFPRRSVILLGEERQGLRPEELAACTLSLRIPMSPGCDSLNVGVAAGVVLFEMRRRGGEGFSFSSSSAAEQTATQTRPGL